MRATRLRARAHALLLPFALAALPAACTDMLTERPRSAIVTETYFTSAADARAAIAAAYRPLSANTNLWDQHLQWGLIAAADEARVGPEEENANIVSLTQLRWTSTNPTTSGVWSGAYQMITRANLVIERVPGIAMDEATKSQIVGEAKFLRALGYHYLVRLYGDVPLVTTSEEQLGTGARTPVAQVYAQIVKDATEAEAALPLTWAAAERGRATKGAAQALLAEHYLWRKEWANASAQTQKIIASNTYSLVPNYIQAFLPGSQNRTEEIFAAQSSTANGAAVVRTAEWAYPRNMNANSAGGWGTYQPLAGFIESYPAGDYRREVSFFTTGRLSTGQEVTFLPHVYKYRPSQRPGQPQDVNWPIFRYADVLLMHAEALNEQGQTAAAIGFVNQVRARARNGTGTENRTGPANLATSLSQAQARDAIFDERKWELAFEGKRWFDLVRRGWDVFRTALATDPTATDVQQTDMLWPIPQGQIDINPALTQNPGY